MAKITEKKVKAPVRDANEKDVEVKEVKEVKKGKVGEILEDVKALIGYKQGAWMWEKLNLEEIEAILNKYL